MTPLAAGTRLGRYEIRSKIGAGGMADVYLAEDTELGRRVALKLLPPDTSTDEQARKRLLREARAAAALDHPHICAVHEVGEAGGHRFIAMQYVEGETLDARLRKTPLAVQDALAIAADVADALAHAHAHGIIHRDIKPSNVIITTRGQAVVLDFGLAKLGDTGTGSGEARTESLLSEPGAILGTIPYMSPEQVRGEELDGRTDLFSLGVTIYEMLSGQRPFAETSAAATASAILTRDPQPLARFSADIPAELERIVSKALRKDVNERYQTAKDFLIDLRALRDEREFKRRLERSAPPEHSREEQVAAAGAARIAEVVRAGAEVPPAVRRPSRRNTLAMLGAVAVLGVAGWYVWQGVSARRASALVPRIQALAEANDYFAAYDLAVTVERTRPGDPVVTRLMPTISMAMAVVTEPAGAQVYLKRFAPDADGLLPPRQLVGTTPLADLRVARGEYVISIEQPGYATFERTVSGLLLRSGQLAVAPPPIRLQLALVPQATMPLRMVFVPGGDYRLVAYSRPTDARVKLGDYFIDKYEVTNQEYKEFVVAGGYLKREFWREPFVKNGRTLSWEEAMKTLVDRTGLPGPRGWSGQNVPDGKADHPVTDVSWYEASAYAVFRGKRLPTVFEWEKAARNGLRAGLVNYMPWGVFYPGDTLLHHANFENKGTMPVGSSEFGMSPFGAYNMAGNVSEWTFNDTSEGRSAVGGAWGEPTYVFARYGMFPGAYGSSTLGFRCALSAPGTTGDQGAMRIEIDEAVPQYKATSDEDFAKWASSYRYEKTPLEPRVEGVMETPEWRRERITFNGADGERAIAYLYLPTHFARPLQVVNLVGAGDVDGGLRSLPASIEDRLAPIIKSGRAVLGVVLKGYIERLRPAGFMRPATDTIEYLEISVNRVTDLRRGLDYVETRPDLDASRIVFFGPSAGAQIGLIAAAVETRYRAVVLAGAGLTRYQLDSIPEANPVYFSSHIRAPKLMMQGRYDEDTPLKTQAGPLFQLLPEPKRLVVYEGGHVAPIEFQVPTLTAWMDEILGAVTRK